MLTLNLTKSAEQDLEEIWLYSLGAWGQAQANNYINEFESLFYLLLDNPQLGQSREDIKQGYRSFSIEKHIVFYRVTEQAIDILRILHVNMDIPQRLIH